MKKVFLVILSFLLLFTTPVIGQKSALLKVQSYQLENGLTILLNPDTSATKVFGAVMVNAGAKQENPEATGMAHYLEHLLFKGTDILGTWSYEKEKPHMDAIRALYDELSLTKDEDKRHQLQMAINQESVEAAEYGLPTEFDKLLRSIGGTEINAFTNYEMTFYHNSFPSHEIFRWLDLYATRFENPVFRSFQTELEVVYEEKNRAMDSFERRLFETMQSYLFPNLPYGQWSVLGTVEHLKNPSLNRMYEFFDTYYVPNNMALILTGNFNVNEVLPFIKVRFGQWQRKEFPSNELPTLTPFTKPVVKKARITPVKAGFLGFQTAPRNHPDRIALDIIEKVLYNEGQTGLINQIELNSEMMYTGMFDAIYNDAGALVIFYVPKIVGQSLKNAEKKIFGVLDQLKSGNFSDELLLGAKAEVSRSFQSQLENLDSRGILIGGAFNAGFSWEEVLEYPKRISNLSRNEIIDIANKYYGKGYVKLISRTGVGKKHKLDKPDYKPVISTQKKESQYAEKFHDIPTLSFEPKFIDFSDDVQGVQAFNAHTVTTSVNPINELFQLQVRFKKGTIADPWIEFAAKIGNKSGTLDLSVEALKSAFSEIGCSYSYTADPNYLTLNIAGDESNLEQCLQMTDQVLTESNPDEKAKSSIINAAKTDRRLEKRSSNEKARMLLSYVTYGDNSYFKRRPSLKELKKVDVSKLGDLLNETTANYEAEIFFSGQTDAETLGRLIEKNLHLSSMPKSIEYQSRKYRTVNQPQVLFVPDKRAVQSQVVFTIQGPEFEPGDYEELKAFGEYFGGGFSGLVTQEIREYRSLAYSTGAWLKVPAIKGEKGNFMAYIGCQADKTEEAIEVLYSLVSDMPIKEERIETLKESLKMKMVTEYPNFRALPETITDLKRMGFERDPNESAFDAFDDLEMKDIVDFYEKTLQGRPLVIGIYGDNRRFDLDELSKFGQVLKIDTDDIVTY